MGQFHAPAASPHRKNPASFKQKAGWAPDLVRTFWRTEQSLVTTGIWTPSHQAYSPVTMMTTILWLHKGHTEPTNTHCRQNKDLQKILKKVVQIVNPPPSTFCGYTHFQAAFPKFIRKCMSTTYHFVFVHLFPCCTVCLS